MHTLPTTSPLPPASAPPQPYGAANDPYAGAIMRRASLPTAPRVRYVRQIRWDNIAIVVTGLIILLFGIPKVLDITSPVTRARDIAASAGGAVRDAIPGLPSNEVKTLEEAMAVVAQARALAAKGEFDDALSQLERVGSAFAAASGADDARNAIIAAQARYEELSEIAQSAAKDEDWFAVDEALVEAKKLAPLTAELDKLHRTAIAHVGSEAMYQRALTRYSSGDYEGALRLAELGSQRYGERRFRDLVTELKDRIARRNQVRNANIRTTGESNPGYTNTGGGGTASGTGSSGGGGTSSGGSTSNGGTGTTQPPATNTGAGGPTTAPPGNIPPPE